MGLCGRCLAQVVADSGYGTPAERTELHDKHFQAYWHQVQRQLPNEYKDFEKINKFWLDLMRKCNADPTALKQATAPKLKENLEKAEVTLDRIQKNLEDYLETKRNAFPRFFFVSAVLRMPLQARRRRTPNPPPLAPVPLSSNCLGGNRLL